MLPSLTVIEIITNSIGGCVQEGEDTVDRRGFLQSSALLAFGGLTAGITAACGSDSADSPTKSTLRIAAFGNPSEKVDLATSTSPSVYVAAYNIWDSLALLVGDEVRNQLAESITPNSDATEWTVTLRDARFSNGSAITASDALASIRALAASTNFAQFWQDLDVERSRVTDRSTLTLALTRPRADFVEATLALSSNVMPMGKPDPTVGSGAYRLESGTGATGFVLAASDHYYGDRPAIPRIELRTIADAAARQNALSSSQVDVALDLSSTAAQTLQSDPRVDVIRMGGGSSNALTLVLNTRMAPFNDPQLRRAMKVAIDREQLVKVVFSGQGTVGNDLIGMGLPGYDKAIAQRRRDVDDARRTFAAKGIRELTLKSSEIVPGMNSASELIKQQLADVGVALTIDQVDPTTFYSDMSSLLSTPFLTSYYVNRPVAASLPFSVGADSPYNFSGYSSPAVESALNSAQSEMNSAKRQGFYDAAQRDIHANGGEIIWGYKDGIVGVVKGVELPVATQGIPLLNAAVFR